MYRKAWARSQHFCMRYVGEVVKCFLLVFQETKKLQLLYLVLSWVDRIRAGLSPSAVGRNELCYAAKMEASWMQALIIQ